MKNIIFIFTLLFCLESMSQTSMYHPFPDSNAIWVGNSWYLYGSSCMVYDDYNLFISGDSTVGNFTYHKLYKNGFLSSDCPPPGNYYFSEFAGLFRQDLPNKKVYINRFGIDTLAYDFNLNVGDTLPVTGLDGTPGNVIYLIDSVLVGADYRKRFWLNDTISVALIEGIGSTYGPFAPIAEPFESGNNLWCFRIDSLPAWTANIGSCGLIGMEEFPEEGQIIIPNPFQTNSVIRSSKILNNASLIFYNLAGQVSIQMDGISGTEINIPMKGISEGIYFLVLTVEAQKRITRKIIFIN